MCCSFGILSRREEGKDGLLIQSEFSSSVKGIRANTWLTKRRIKLVSNIETAKTAEFALVELHLRPAWQYGEVLLPTILGEFSNTTLQESCRETLKNLKILTVLSLPSCHPSRS